MSKAIQFVYEKEFWYISAIIDTKRINIKEKVAEIQDLLIKKFHNLTEKDLEKISWNKPLLEQVRECGKNISLNCRWVSYVDYFPFFHENIGLQFNQLGYLEFDVEYFPKSDDLSKKEKIPPELIQQIPIVALKVLEDYCKLYVNQCLCLDLKSPIYIFVVSQKIKDEQGNIITIRWSEEKVLEYKEVLGKWTEIYSGQWPDYSERLYTKRVQNNLSNRLSELHFIRRNSGFIYMNSENYKLFFENYMKNFVLTPTAQIRAILFALTSINESLDILFSMIDYMDIRVLEEKIIKLRKLRGIIQTELSSIYNELDSNRRQHYSSVLSHLINLFNLAQTLERINNKFDVIHDLMEMRYIKKSQENQARVEKGMNYLNFLFGIAVFAEAIQWLISAILGKDLILISVNGIALILITIILFLVTQSFLRLWKASRGEEIRKTVDAVIIDNKRVLLIERKYPPFKGRYALPGGFIEKGESPKEAIIREVKEETGLDIKVLGKVGVYDKPGRDPRGQVHSTAFVCLTAGAQLLKETEEAKVVKFIALDELKGIDLAFDHEIILRDALKYLAIKDNNYMELANDYEKLLQNSSKINGNQISN